MSLVSVSGLVATIGARSLFTIADARLERGARVALVGPNGVGKSTLLAAIDAAARGGGARRGRPRDVGELAAELEGTIAVARGLTVRRLRQDPPRVGAPPAADARALWHLPDLPREAMSGGQRTRAALADALAEAPDVLLLDEPTNHLDTAAIDTLAAALRGYDGCALVVSHDRAFLDRMATEVWELDRPWQPEGATLRRYPGNYRAYRSQAHHAAESARRAYDDDRRHIEHLKESAERQRAWSVQAYAHAGVRDPYAQKKARRMAQRATAANRRLERAQAGAAAKPWERDAVALPSAGETFGGRYLLTGEDLVVGRDRPLLRLPTAAVQARDRIALAGRNGTGKTTLLRTLAGELAPLSGRLWRSPALAVATVSQDREDLGPGEAAVDILAGAGPRSAEARAMAAALGLRGDRAMVPVEALSGGERTAVSLALALVARAHLLLLDEPTNHLDLWLREAVEAALEGFAGAVVMATHDRWLLEQGGWQVWHLEPGAPGLVRPGG